MSFRNTVSRPGDDVELVLEATPGSKFAVSAVDSSIRLMGETNDIKENQVQNNRLLLDFADEIYGRKIAVILDTSHHIMVIHLLGK